MRSHTLHSFFPGIFLGAVIGLIFGSLWMAKVADGEMQRLRQSYESNGITVVGEKSCALTSKAVSFVSTNEGKGFDLKVGAATVERFTFEGWVNPIITLQNDEYAYISVQPDGLGGYILYPSLFSLYRVDLCDGAVDVLTDIFQGSQMDYAMAISPDEQLVAVQSDDLTISIDRIEGSERLQVFEADNNLYGVIGDVVFSPDSSKVAFAAAFNDPEAEGGSIYIGDIATGTLQQYEKAGKEAGEGAPHVRGWYDNETVDWY